MSENEKRRMVMPEKPGCFPPYYPDEDRQLAAELMDLAAKLMDVASRVIKPDHYWNPKPMPPIDPPPILPMAKDK